ncbi:hypothetical protein BGS_0489 [Beggiatoa sp. SS]|nr:hypothetical protein BGS_0489 [Beggiatoa sp. SS]
MKNTCPTSIENSLVSQWHPTFGPFQNQGKKLADFHLKLGRSSTLSPQAD